MSGIIDFHSHILPGVDDGSSSVEESLAMLGLEAVQGIGQVIATPHFYPRSDSPERFLHRRAEAEARLRRSLEGEMDLPQLRMGAEVYFFPGISESDHINQLTIDGKKCILLEMPKAPWTQAMYREMENIYVRQGLTPIIAHVDRYIAPFRTYGIPDRLASLPVLVQANASFFLSRSTRGMALRLLKQDKIHLLGSDCHDLVSRKPNLGEAVQLIRAKLGDGVLERVEAHQEQILE